MARQFYQSTSLARTTQTSATPTTVHTLTFTPDANSDYLLIWSGLVDYSTSGQTHGVRIWDGSAVVLDYLTRVGAREDDFYRALAGCKVVSFGASPSSVSYSVQLRGNGTNAAGLAESRLIAIKLGANDFYANYSGGTTTTSSTYQDRVTATVPAGARTYLLLFSAGLHPTTGVTNDTFRSKIRALLSGTTTLWELNPAHPVSQATSLCTAVFGARVQSLSGGESIKIQWGSTDGTGTILCNQASIVGLDLAGFADAEYIESLTEDSTTSTSAQDKTELSFSSAATDYLVISSATLRVTESTANEEDAFARLLEDGAAVWAAGDIAASAISGTPDRYIGAASARVATYGAAARSLKWQYYASSTGTTAKLGSAVIAALALGDAGQEYDEAVTETPTAADTAAGQLNAAGSITETSTAADTAAAQLNAAGSLTETPTAADTAAGQLGAAASLAEAATPADATATLWSGTETLAEAASPADAATGTFTADAAATDAASPADAAALTVDHRPTLAEAVTPADSAEAPGLAAVGAVAEAATATDDALGNVAGTSSLTETASPTDSASGGFILNPDVTEAATPADAAAAGLILAGDAAEAASPSDGVANALTAAGAVTDAATPADAPAANVSGAEALTETASPADALAASNALAAAAGESAAPVDAVAASNAVASTLTETGAPTDAVTGLLTLAGTVPAETITPVFTPAVAVTLAADFDESVGAADDAEASASFTASLTETVSPSDLNAGVVSLPPPPGGLKGLSQLPALGDVVQLFTLDLSFRGGPVWHFTNNAPAITFDGITYLPLPIMAEGFELRGEGAQPRPLLRVGNALKVLASGVQAYDALRGAKVTRLRTLHRFCDDQLDADPTAHYPLEIYYIDRKSAQGKAFIEWELVNAFDYMARRLPGRRILRDFCTHSYRRRVGSEWVMGSCPYSNAAVFDRNDVATNDPTKDVCSKRLSGCRARFSNALPFLGFPGVNRRA